MSKIKKSNLKLGWGDIILISAFMLIIIWSILKRISLNDNVVYTNGTVIGIKKGAKGSVYLHYKFAVNGKEIEGSVPPSSCEGCKPGDSISVKYDNTDYKNNGIVKKLSD